jgi:hypothetical protein
MLSSANGLQSLDVEHTIAAAHMERSTVGHPSADFRWRVNNVFRNHS